MYKQNLNLLILEDNPIDAKLIVTKLENDGFVLEWKRVETEKAFRKALAEKPEIILADYELPLYDGLSAIKLQQQIAPAIPLILVSGISGEDIAVECMKTGAIDYVLKNRLSRLGFVVKRALKEAEAYRERKKTEDALKESEKKYRTLTENLNVGIFRDTLGPKGKFIEMNPALIKIFGYKNKEEVLKLNVSDLYQNPEERKNFNRQIIENGFVKDEELNLIKKDGSALIGSVSAVAVKDKNGKVKHYDGIIEDITERKKIEKELIQKNIELNSFINNIPDMAWLKDKHSNFIVTNKAFGEAVGMDPKYLISQTCEVCFGKKAANKFKKDDKKVMESRKQITIEESIKDAQGNTIFLETIKSPIYNKPGDVIGTVGIARNITERKQAEEDLKQSEQKYRTLVENIQDGVFFIRDKKLKFVNKAFAKISGYTTEEIIGMDFSEFVAPEDLYMVKDRYIKMMAGKDVPMEYEFRGIRKESNERTIVYMNVGLINFQGKKAALGTLKDITERRKMEEALRESEEKYRTLIENIEEGIGIVDENEKFVFVNFAAS
ncbi:MAG: PAS domain S-box protein, partial [Bacteroidales bacterium]|nr:PAS domain S-box protein [Bacteroidales bacterium]